MNPLDYFPLEVSQKIFSYQPCTMQPILCRVSKQWQALAEDDALWNQTYGCTKQGFQIKVLPIIRTFSSELINDFGGIERFVDYPKLDVKLTEENKKFLRCATVPDNFISLSDMTAPIMWCQLPITNNLLLNVQGIVAMRIHNIVTDKTSIELISMMGFGVVTHPFHHTSLSRSVLEQTVQQFLNNSSPQNPIYRLV